MITTQTTSIHPRITFDSVDVDKALSLASVAIWQFSFISKEIIAHDNLYQILGFSPGSFATDLSGFKTLIHPDDKSPVFQALEQHRLEKKYNYFRTAI